LLEGIKIMRLIPLAFVLVAIASPSFAQKTETPPASTAQPATTAPKYSTAETDIGTLIDDPAAKAIVEKHIPGLTTNAQIDMARAMTLKAIQQYAADEVTDERLAAIDADLAKLSK
jgi:hypothetical protein